MAGRVLDQGAQLAPVVAEHHLTPGGGGGGVEVHDHAGHVLDGGERALDQIAPCGREDHHGDILGHGARRGQVTGEAEVGLAGRGVTGQTVGPASGSGSS
ncbi:hypothetical protein [Nonomuraea maheshkhaliensis]|uniref:hypothetical protein n=1 Tax=Nonomuraea maheshkhaliensis TaxID=419590 RepID=UPI003D1594B2